LVAQQLNCCTATRLEAAAKALDRVLEEVLMRIGVQSGHGALCDCVRQTLHSLATRAVMVTVEHLLAARIEHTEAGIDEVPFVVVFALAETSSS
jgi:hypothetical protein